MATPVPFPASTEGNKMFTNSQPCLPLIFQQMFLLGSEAVCTVRNYLSFTHIYNELRNCQAVGKLSSLPLTVSDTTWLTQKSCSGPESLTPPIALYSEITKSISHFQKKEKENPQEHTKSMSNSFAP